jgi:hypothetical protein
VCLLSALQALAESFQAKRKAGLVQGHGSGYGGSGYKFDKSEDAKIKAARKSKAKVSGRGCFGDCLMSTLQRHMYCIVHSLSMQAQGQGGLH